MSSSTLHYPSARHLSQLYAGREENLSAAERLLAVKIITREDWITFEGEAAAIASAWSGRSWSKPHQRASTAEMRGSVGTGSHADGPG